jgi:integrase
VKESIMTTVSVRPTYHTPAYRRQQKKSGQDLAFVRLDGKRIYLGTYDSPESRARYHQLIAEWEMAGRILPSPPDRISIAEIARQYLAFAKTYYVKNGHPTSEPENIILAIRPLLEMFGKIPAVQFGPKSLKLVRQNMIHRGWTRKYTNKHVDRVKRMFKWAVAEELIPAGVYEALRAVVGLRHGRCGAPDNPPVQSAPVDRVEATKRHLNRQVTTMLELQLLTGARPGEIVIMRPMDIDRNAPVWIYKPDEHKTQHHGHDRLIFVGPQAQQILTPFLLRAPDAYCFSPAEAEKERREAKHERRITPKSCGNSVGTNRKDNPRRAPKNRYTTGSYRRAIDRMILKAFPLPESLPNRHKGETLKAWKLRMTDDQRQQYSLWRKSCWWHPHQLRHNYATTVRHKYGLEAAQVLLGHSKADVTQIYAERDMNNATQVAAKIG